MVVRGNPLLGVRTDRPDISTGRESQVSVQHAVAAALVTGKAGLDQFTDACVRDPRVQALRSKVEVQRDPAFSTIAAAVEITTADGKIHKLSQAAARGSDVNPLDDADLEEKLRTVAAGWDPRLRHGAADRCDLGARQERGCFRTGLAGGAALVHGRTAGASTGMPCARDFR